MVGGPGSGKTIFSLQFLLHGIRDVQEPGIFVAFEESPARIVANLAGFGWNITEIPPAQLYFMDAQPARDQLRSGTFDLSGMLAALGAQADAMGARRIVFDALDVLLALLPDVDSKREEVYRLNDWLLTRGMTGLITAKEGADEATSFSQQPASSFTQQPFGFMQFMVDCAVVLNHRVMLGVSQRNLRVQKFRGSSFDENESAFVIGSDGFDVAVARRRGAVDMDVSSERVTSGVDRMDTMLGGGYYRGASVLITGVPGTAKTTLSGCFAQSACERGEKTLFVGFDSDGTEVVRNLLSVGIHLAKHVDSGMLRMISARTLVGSAETLLVRIKALTKEHGARCLVIDPVSTLSKPGNELTAHGVAERLIDWTKSEGITMVCTSLFDEMAGQVMEGGRTPLQISTLADTWIHLSYLVQAGERNRGMSIIKSRGTAHSNQVRELILSNEGVTLADIFTAGGEVLMGTMRWEKESAERLSREVREVAGELDLVRLEAEEAVLEVRAKAVQTELLAKQVEKRLLAQTRKSRQHELERGHTHMRELRGADDNDPAAGP